MSQKAEIVYVLKDNFSETLREIQEKQRLFNKDLAGLQKNLTALNKTKAEIKIKTDTARRELQAAQKAFKEFTDAEHEAAVAQKQLAFDDAKQQLNEYETQIRNATKAMHGLTAEESKSSARQGASKKGGGIEESSFLAAGQAILGSQLASQLGNSLSAALGANISSAYGQGVGDSISNIGGGLLSGAAAGAALGSIIPGLGTAVGAVIGGAVGSLAGIIQDAAQKKQDRDQYFKDTAKDIYNEVLEIRQNMVTSGSEVAANRETLQMAFANLLKEEAGAVSKYVDASTPLFGVDKGELAPLLMREVEVTGVDKNEYAKQFLEDVNVFSRETPFNYDELTSISKTLLTYGYKSTEMFDLLTKMGDAGSALGWDSSSKVAVATYLGRMNLTDKVTMEYINPLMERGVQVIDYIKQSLEPSKGKLSDADIMEMISNGDLSGKAVSKTLLEYMGFDYEGAMEEMQNSYEGLQSTLEGWEADMQAAFGGSFNETRKAQMREQIDWYEQNADGLKEMYGKVGEYEANLVGAKEAEMRSSMDDLLERSKEIADGQTMSDELYAAIADAEVKYLDSDAYQELYDSQQRLIEAVRNDLAQVNYDCGYSLGQEFTKGYNAAILAQNPMYYEGNVPQLEAPLSPTPAPGYAYGISYIPYDNFPARLHQGERVLTAAQARQMDAKQSSGGVVVTGNTFVVREESDIDAIAYALYEKLEAASSIYID